MPEVTIREAAEKTGYSGEYLRRIIPLGVFKARKSGAVWLIDLESLLDYQKSQQKKEKTHPDA